MTDCSELKDAYEKAKEEANSLQGEADRAQDAFEDADSDYDFEADRDCVLHNVTVTLPNGTTGTGPDTEGQADCLREKGRATSHAAEKKERARDRMEKANWNAGWAQRNADSALHNWCLCEAKNRHGGDGGEGGEGGGGPEGQFGDWNEVKWDEYATA